MPYSVLALRSSSKCTFNVFS